MQWLKNNFLGDILQDRQFAIDLGRNESKQANETFILDTELNQYRYYHPYMFARKMNEKVINIFDIRI